MDIQTIVFGIIGIAILCYSVFRIGMVFGKWKEEDKLKDTGKGSSPKKISSIINLAGGLIRWANNFYMSDVEDMSIQIKEEDNNVTFSVINQETKDSINCTIAEQIKDAHKLFSLVGDYYNIKKGTYRIHVYTMADGGILFAVKEQNFNYTIDAFDIVQKKIRV